MNADRVAKTTGLKGLKGIGYGLVIINLQKTQYDEISSLRIFATIDDALNLLKKELGLSLPFKLPLYENQYDW